MIVWSLLILGDMTYAYPLRKRMSGGGKSKAVAEAYLRLLFHCWLCSALYWSAGHWLISPCIEPSSRFVITYDHIRCKTYQFTIVFNQKYYRLFIKRPQDSVKLIPKLYSMKQLLTYSFVIKKYFPNKFNINIISLSMNITLPSVS